MTYIYDATYRYRRGELTLVRRYSITPKRLAYMDAGEPYGKNRKGLKRWLREGGPSNFALGCDTEARRAPQTSPICSPNVTCLEIIRRKQT